CTQHYFGATFLPMSLRDTSATRVAQTCRYTWSATNKGRPMEATMYTGSNSHSGAAVQICMCLLLVVTSLPDQSAKASTDADTPDFAPGFVRSRETSASSEWIALLGAIGGAVASILISPFVTMRVHEKQRQVDREQIDAQLAIAKREVTAKLVSENRK